MSAATPLASRHDIMSVGRRLLSVLRDPRSNTTRIGRMVESVGGLDRAVVDFAVDCFNGRGEVKSVHHAINLIGYTRLECVIRDFLREQYMALSASQAVLPTHLSPLEPRIHPSLEAAKKRILAV